VRLEKNPCLSSAEEAPEQIRGAREWSPRQWQVIETLLLELRHAQEQRERWHSLIAQEVLADAELASTVRLCGVREIVAFALGAFIGDIKRFAEPKKLVKYCGLDPAFDDSGESEWSGGIGGHGNKYLRGLLIEAAHSILRCSQSPLAKWGKRLLARKGEIRLVVAAMARRLAVAVWYLMNGRWTSLEEIDSRLAGKVTKMIGSVGEQGLKALGKDRKAYRQEIYERLKAGRVYVLDPNKKYTPKPKAQPEAKASEAGLAYEYGLR
jgi:hypothetical protein